MKRFYWLMMLTVMSVAMTAQTVTQQGVVKTRGRMVNGKHVQGKGLSGATVQVKGRSAVVSQQNGNFSFPIPSQTFLVQSVTKQGYQLVDADDTKKAYKHSDNPLYLVMETPEQQMDDQLEAEERISKTLREQLKKSRMEIQRLKDEQRITEEEYRQRLAQLMEDQKNNQTLIADMAKEYAQMDYDQMDDQKRRISDAILNGRLTEAKSLLRSKGDMKSRDAEITRRQQAEAQRKAEIAQEQQNLAQSEAGTQRLLDDFASDCYEYYRTYCLENKHDSAAYYIELRAHRDTTNAEWQFDAAYYFDKQNQFHQAESFYAQALKLYRRRAQQDPQAYEPDVARTLNNLAALYNNTQRFTDSEAMYKEALEIRRRLAQQDPQAYEPDVAMTLNNLAGLYSRTQRFTESEAMYKEALEIRRRLAQQHPQAYEPDVAGALNNLAALYYNTQRFAESEAMYKEALEIYRRLAQQHPQAYESGVAMTLNNLALLYSDTQRFTESEAMYEEALEIYRRLAQQNPQAYEPYVAGTLNNLAILYSDTQRFTESEAMYKEALEIRRRLAQQHPQAYEPNVAGTLNGLALLYSRTQRFTESEAMHKEALEIRRRLAQQNPQAYEPDVAATLNNLANLYYNTQRFTEGEAMYKEALEIYRRLAQHNPQTYESDVAMTLYNLAALYYNTQRFAESEAMYKEVLEIYRRLAQQHPQAYEPDMAETLYSIGLLKGRQAQYQDAIAPFEESIEIYRRIMKVNPAQRQWYEAYLYYLGPLYSQVGNYSAAYKTNQEFLPILKEKYAASPASLRSDYAGTLGSQAFHAIFMKRYQEAEQLAHEGIAVDSTQHFIYANLAAALLFQGKYTEAEKIYRQYKAELKDGFIDDFRQFAEAGVIPKECEADVERIRRMLEE